MVYEALSSGAACGLLELEARSKGRVVAGMQQLVQRKAVLAFSQWEPGSALAVPTTVFNEADRCARWIAHEWLRVE